MSVQSEPAAPSVTGEYRVTKERSGEGIDHYLRVVGPDGRATEQKVLWTYSKTAFQVAEEAVAGHLGQGATTGRTTSTRLAPDDSGYVVTVV